MRCRGADRGPPVLQLLHEGDPSFDVSSRPPHGARGDGAGSAAADLQRLHPGAVALDPLMHPAGPREPHAGAQHFKQLPWSHATRPGGELCLQPDTLFVGVGLVGHTVGAGDDRQGQ
ncbi:MAG TPA: hypothetical protein VKR78_06700 [Acidimicrobiales bacterium]|nr:hypothetical protein [Acidimicrobiales bacterium]